MDPNSLSPELRRIFGAVQLTSDDRTYCVVGLPRDQMRAATILFGGLAEPFSAMIVDSHEITIVMHDMDWSIGARDLDGQRLARDFRLITFDPSLDLDTVGFMAVVSRLLSEVNVALLPLGAYSRDHILVRSRDFERAWQTLSEFIAACRATADGE